MLIVKFDKTRSVEQGQYWVELIKNRDLTVVNCDRLGYWCDKAHLRSMVMEMTIHFSTYEIFRKLLQE